MQLEVVLRSQHFLTADAVVRLLRLPVRLDKVAVEAVGSRESLTTERAVTAEYAEVSTLVGEQRGTGLEM